METTSGEFSDPMPADFVDRAAPPPFSPPPSPRPLTPADQRRLDTLAAMPTRTPPQDAELSRLRARAAGGDYWPGSNAGEPAQDVGPDRPVPLTTTDQTRLTTLANVATRTPEQDAEFAALRARSDAVRATIVAAPPGFSLATLSGLQAEFVALADNVRELLGRMHDAIHDSTRK